MALLPPHALRRVSSYVRGAIVIYLVALLCTSFAMPDLLQRQQGPAAGWMLLFPSCWFAALCQVLRHRASPAMTQLASYCPPGIVALFAIAFCAYAAGYRRHFIRIAETSDDGVVTHSPSRWRWTFVQRLVLRSPFQKGCFRFVSKTLVRSEIHRLVMTAVGGLALVLASQALMSAAQTSKSLRQVALSPDALSIPFILTFVLIIGLRVVFEIPTDLRANWIFQLLLDSDHQECEALARKVVLVLTLPWVLGITFAIYLYLAGLTIACLHTLLVATWSILLTNLVLARFRKLPFTCSLPVFKQYSIVILIAFCFGYLIYAVFTPEFESWALFEPIQFLRLLPAVVLAWYVPRHLNKTTIDLERKLIFEESAVRTVEGLRLSE